MATLEHESLPPLPSTIREQLNALRAGIRRYVWLEGLAAMAVWLGAAFWGSIALDYSFEPPQTVRAVVLGLAGLGLAVVLFRYILRRAFVGLSDGNMATILERHFPQLNDSLLTSVVLLERPADSQGINPRMLAQTSDLARQRLDNVPVSEVFNPWPLVRKIVIALGLTVAVGVLAAMDARALGLWYERNLLLADVRWPRKIRLEAVGFTDGVAKVAAGSNFDLRVQAFRGDTEFPIVPERVDIRYRAEGGSAERKTMKNIGRPRTAASNEGEPLREYSYPFLGVLSSIDVDVYGGDASLRGLHLKVVPNPTLSLKLVCEYPPYMERGPLVVDQASGAVPVRVPIGSRITICGSADKPLEMVRIDSAVPEPNSPWPQQFEGQRLGPELREFACSFVPFPGEPISAASGKKEAQKPGDKSGASETAKSPHENTLQFTLRDIDGLRTRNPVSVTLVAVPDEPPEVKVRLVGTREPAVTPQGRLPVTGSISDDHGLSKYWAHYTVEARPVPVAPKQRSDDPAENPGATPKAPAQRSGNVALTELPEHPTRVNESQIQGTKPLGEYTELPKHPAEHVVKEADVKAADLRLAIGERLTLAVEAADLYAFGNGPNIGSGETWQLDVITQDELVTRLEARELLVKQRFEQIVEEMTETRNLLLKMDFSPPSKSSVASPKVKQAGSEPGDRPEDTPKFTLEQLNTRRLERTLQALQNCRKNAVETADIAAAIEEIRLQLDNNQANNETRKQRIEVRVLQPLRKIVDFMFPLLDQRLVALQAMVNDLSAGPERRDAALRQAEEILALMRDVLDHMMKAEDFNINVIQRLKKIIERQKELTQQTEKSEQDSLGDKE